LSCFRLGPHFVGHGPFNTQFTGFCVGTEAPGGPEQAVQITASNAKAHPAVAIDDLVRMT
jgi:hypothetical protein